MSNRPRLTKTIDGRTFDIDNVAEETGLGYAAAALRFRKHDNLEEMFRPRRPYSAKENVYVIEGERFTVKEAAKRLNMSQGGAYKRLLEARTLEELFRARGVSLTSFNTDLPKAHNLPEGKEKRAIRDGNRSNDWFKDWDDPIFKLTFGWGQPK